MSLLVPKEWRAEVNPWTRDDELARALILRGAILWSYSHIERRMMDFIIRCAQMPEYHDIAENPPFRRAKRIGYIREVLKGDGPFRRYERLGAAILKRYEASAEIRNRMAHADHDFLGAGLLRLRDFALDGTKVIRDRWWNYYPGHLEREAVKAARFSKAIQRLHYRTFGDSPLDGDDASE